MNDYMELIQKSKNILSTGPVVRDAKTNGLIISIDNTTSQDAAVNIYIFELKDALECKEDDDNRIEDIRSDEKKAFKLEKHLTVNIKSNTKKTLKLDRPSLIYEIVFGNALEGVTFQVSTIRSKPDKTDIIKPTDIIEANTFNQIDLIDIKNNPNKTADRVFTGALVKDSKAHSLIAVVQNTTPETKIVNIVLSILNPTGKNPVNKKVLLHPFSTQAVILEESGLIYDISFDNVSDGIYCWTSTRMENLHAPLKNSNLIAANTLCYTKLIGGVSNV